MWKVLFFLFLYTPVYSQVFTEDIAQINHFLSENEVDNFAKKPTPEGLPGDYLSSLVAQKYLDPYLNCEDDPFKYRPEKVRYEVLAVTEELPSQETTVFVAKYQIEEEEHVLVKDLKKIIMEQPSDPGTIKKSFSQDAGKKIIHYVSPGTEIKLNSEVRGENSYKVNLKGSDETAPIESSVKVDVVNRLDINQAITSDTQLKTSLEAKYTTGTRDIKALEDTTFFLDKIKAQARVDQKINHQTSGYTEVSFSGNDFEKDVRVVAGLDFKLPRNAEILVFTGHRNSQKHLAGRQEEAEVGVQYKNKNGVKVFGRFREGSDNGKTYEAGVEIPLGH